MTPENCLKDIAINTGKTNSLATGQGYQGRQEIVFKYTNPSENTRNAQNPVATCLANSVFSGATARRPMITRDMSDTCGLCQWKVDVSFTNRPK